MKKLRTPLISVPEIRRSHVGIALLLVTACLGGYGLALSGLRSTPLPSAPKATFSAQRAAVPAGIRAGQAPAARNDSPGGPARSNSTKVPSAIIRTANLSVVVPPKKTQRAADQATTVASRLGGYVLSSTFDRHSGDVNLVVRVPAQKFDNALTSLRRLGIVRTENIRGKDVSLQLVDLTARLQNLEMQRAELLRLFSRAANVGDTIKVQQVLADVQYQVEQTQGWLRYLSKRTSLATINLSLHGVPGTTTGRHPGRISGALAQALTASETVIAGSIIVVGYLFPFVVLLLVVYAASALWQRRFASRHVPPVPEVSPD